MYFGVAIIIVNQHIIITNLSYCMVKLGTKKVRMLTFRVFKYYFGVSDYKSYK